MASRKITERQAERTEGRLPTSWSLWYHRDLAKVMTFRSLYRLEAAGSVGVAVGRLTGPPLRDHGRRREGRPRRVPAFRRPPLRCSGDFTDAATYGEVAKAMGDAKMPVLDLEHPPSLFGTAIEQLAKADLAQVARVVVEKPSSATTSSSAKALNDEIHAYIDESQLYRIDHFLGKMGLIEILYLRFANTTSELVWNRNYVSSVRWRRIFGVEDRGASTTPSVRLRATWSCYNDLLDTLVGDGSADGGDASVLKDSIASVFSDSRRRPQARARSGRGLPRRRRGRQGLEDRDVRCVASRSRTGGGRRALLHPCRQGAAGARHELRVVFHHPPAAWVLPQGHQVPRDQIGVQVASGHRDPCEA